MSSSALSYCSTPLRLPLPRRQHITSSPPSIIIKANASSSFVCLTIGLDDIAEIAQNKVLVAATLSAAIGQLSKPLASSLIYRNNVDFRTLVRAGGFPSVHSAAVVAAATSIGLERGFSDSIFGMTVIYAALVMYDAQGVRLEVGKHAKVLNKTIVFKPQNSTKESLVDSNTGTSVLTKSETPAPLLSISQKTSSHTPNTVNSTLYLTSENRRSAVPSSIAIDSEPMLKETSYTFVPLEESIGHTLVEVIAGALLGFLVTLGVYNVM